MATVKEIITTEVSTEVRPLTERELFLLKHIFDVFYDNESAWYDPTVADVRSLIAKMETRKIFISDP